MDKKTIDNIEDNRESEETIDNLDNDVSEPETLIAPENVDDVEKIGLDNKEKVEDLEKDLATNETSDDSEEIEDLENDELIEKDYLSVLAEQSDRVVFYEISNIYKNEKKREYKNKFELRKDPPILEIKDNFGGEVDFLLTENFAKELMAGLKEVDRAYSGFSGPVDLDAPEKFKDRMIYYIKKNPIKFVIPIVLFIITAILSIM